MSDCARSLAQEEDADGHDGDRSGPTARTEAVAADRLRHPQRPRRAEGAAPVPVRALAGATASGSAARGYAGAYYPRASPNAARDRRLAAERRRRPAPTCRSCASSCSTRWDIDFGVLNPLLGAGAPAATSSTAPRCATAVNDWQIAEWLDPEPRLRASMVVPYEDGDLAAAEIERRAGDQPASSRCCSRSRTSEPLGRRKYWPIYEAAARARPADRHPLRRRRAATPITGAGWPSFYIEDHAGMPQAFQAQVISLVFEGVFERFPTLKVVLIEGGFAWLPSLMWRLDRAWEQLRDEVPHLQAAAVRVHPRALLADHPADGGAAQAGSTSSSCSTHLGMDDRLMFATDYPHWDFDAPDQAFPARLPPTWSARSWPRTRGRSTGC